MVWRGVPLIKCVYCFVIAPTAACNSSSRGFGALFWPPWAPALKWVMEHSPSAFVDDKVML